MGHPSDTCSAVPDVAADSWRSGTCNLPAGHGGSHVNDSCHTWEQPAALTTKGALPVRGCDVCEALEAQWLAAYDAGDQSRALDCKIEISRHRHDND